MPTPARSQQAREPRICSSDRVHMMTGVDTDAWPERLRRGDTIGVAREIAGAELYCPAEMTTLTVLLPFLRDSARAALLGLGDRPYEDIIWRLAAYPSAVSGDTGALSCTPEACALLARQWREATDPRLRDVGLVALMAGDPARWADTIISLAERGDGLLSEPAARLLGIYSSSVGSMPMPKPDANWHEWLLWTRGTTFPDKPGAPPNFDNWHGERPLGVRLFQLRTGRDFVTEWRADLVRAPNDTARYLFETLLAPWRGWDPPAIPVIEAQLRAGDALNYARAGLAISEMFRRSGEPLDAGTAAAVADTIPRHDHRRQAALAGASRSRGTPTANTLLTTGDWSKANGIATAPRRGSILRVCRRPPSERAATMGQSGDMGDRFGLAPATGPIPDGADRYRTDRGSAGAFLKVGGGSLHTFSPDAVRATGIDGRTRDTATHISMDALLLRSEAGG